MAKFDAFDISDEDEPDLEAKIMDIQRRRLVADPELAELLGIVVDDGINTVHQSPGLLSR
jgi:hypothetical protein